MSDLAGMLVRLDELVQQAKAMPLSSSVLINREEIAALVADMQEALPEEIVQAQWVISDRDELLRKAREQADALVARGQQEQVRLAEREEVVRRAHEEAARILAQAQDEARHLRVESEAYVDEKLSGLVGALQAALSTISATESTLTQGLAQAEHGQQRLRVPSVESSSPRAPAIPEFFDEEEVRP